MKSKILPLLFAGVIGVALGWFARGDGNEGEDIPREEDRTALSGWQAGRSTRTISSRQDSSRGSRSGDRPQSRWLPVDEQRFLDPTTEADRAEIRRLMRGAIEKEANYHTRMKAVADLLALMTPENARDIRDAFVNSRKDGFWYATERKVFLARYGEVLGAEAMEDFKDDPDFVRILESWALVEPAGAVAWVNGIEPGSKRDAAIGRLIGAFGSTDVAYAVEVFSSLTEPEQSRHQQALSEAAIRSGGKEACAQLAANLLASDDANLQRAGQRALGEAWDLYANFESGREWLEGLPPEHLALLDPSKLPEEFRSVHEARETESDSIGPK